MRAGLTRKKLYLMSVITIPPGEEFISGFYTAALLNKDKTIPHRRQKHLICISFTECPAA